MIKFKKIKYHEVDILKNMTIRQADVDELKAVTGYKDAWKALRHSVKYSLEWTEIAYDDETGEVLTVFGLSSVEDCGIPWMVSSPNMIKHKKLLMRYAKKVIKEMLKQFETLFNYVDARNELHIRWLKHMEFQFTGRDLIINGVPFRFFYKRRNK